MGFDLDVTIPAITVFVQGLLSFFSPCILPIIPLYMGYLSGGTMEVDENGVQKFNQKKLFINTIFFILGVSFAFFILGLGFSALGQFFTKNQMLFSRIGGVLIILLGLVQLGVLDEPFKGREFRLPFKINTLKMSPIMALLMGFVFSFAWTPCVGPALSTVLIMVSSASTTAQGIMLMGVYTIGFTLPFLVLGIFTTKCLDIFKKHRNIVSYTIKIGAVIMILMGLMMFTGTMNSITKYLSDYTNTLINEESPSPDSEEDVTVSPSPDSTQESTASPNASSNIDGTEESESDKQEADENKEDTPEILPALDFELQDQYGNVHKLSDYKGKTIFLNIWATWCPPCRKEMPDIEALYKNYGYNEEDVIVLGVAFPNDNNSYTQEGSKQEIIDFLDENNFTYPTLMDMDASLLTGYGITSFPTTFMIDTEGNVFGYVPGMMSYDIMESIVEQTVAGKMNE